MCPSPACSSIFELCLFQGPAGGGSHFARYVGSGGRVGLHLRRRSKMGRASVGHQ